MLGCFVWRLCTAAGSVLHRLVGALLLPLAHAFAFKHACRAPAAAEKQLRCKLEGEYGCDLADRKALLRAEINAYLRAEEVGCGCVRLGC